MIPSHLNVLFLGEFLGANICSPPGERVGAEMYVHWHIQHQMLLLTVDHILQLGLSLGLEQVAHHTPQH